MINKSNLVIEGQKYPYLINFQPNARNRFVNFELGLDLLGALKNNLNHLVLFRIFKLFLDYLISKDQLISYNL